MKWILIQSKSKFAISVHTVCSFTVRGTDLAVLVLPLAAASAVHICLKSLCALHLSACPACVHSRHMRAARTCPDPTVSCYPSHKHFGAVPERLLAELNSFIKDNKNFSKSTATTE